MIYRTSEMSEEFLVLRKSSCMICQTSEVPEELLFLGKKLMYDLPDQ